MSGWVTAPFSWYISVKENVYMPREVVEEYGDMNDWRRVIGTGPFMLTDYVEGSVMTFERNPNYWRKHPIFGDQMPYLDS